MSAPLAASRVIARLCTESHREGDHEVHKGFVPLADGYEFVGALGAWHPNNRIKLLPDGGSWPYAFALADDDERSMIHYVEGDLIVCVYDTAAAYGAALARYANG